MLRHRRSLLFCLALLIGLTGQQMALARGQGSAVGQMVLCIGGQAVSVAIDDEGKPAGPAHICPDCALNFMAALLPQSTALQAPLAPDSQRVVLVAQSPDPHNFGLPQPRGPPSLT